MILRSNAASCGLLLLTLLAGRAASAQTTVPYQQQTGLYSTPYTMGTAGAFNQGSTQLGLYANGGATKQVAVWRRLRTDGGAYSGGSDRSLQVGDRLTITLSAVRAWGQIGFALLASPPATTSWSDRNAGAALSINLDGKGYNNGIWGDWYLTYRNGATASAGFGAATDGNGNGQWRDYTFTITLTAPGLANVTVSDNSATPRSATFYDVPLASTAPITDYCVYLDDDYDGSANNNCYWGLDNGTTHSLTNTGSLAIGGSNGSSTIGDAIGNGLNANSASANSLSNALIKSGTGTLTLSGANTFAGGVTVNGGTLLLARSGGSTLPAGSNVTVNSGGTLRISSDQSLGNLIVNSGATLTVDAGVNLTLTGTVTFSGTTSFGTGSTTTFAGTGQAIPLANYYHFATSGTGAKSFPNTGTVGVAGTFSVSGTAPSAIYSSTINYNGTGAQTIATYSYGTLQISGNRGGATISFGSNTISIGGSMNYTATNAVQDPGTSTVRYGTGQTIVPMNYYNLVCNGAGAYLVAGTVNIAGSLAYNNPPTLLGASTVNFNGTGAQTIPAANYYNLTISGARGGAPVTLASGTLNVSNAFSAPASNVQYSSSGNTFNYSGTGAQTVYGPFTYNNLSNSGNGARTLANAVISVKGTYTPTTGSTTIGTSTVDFAATGAQTIPSGSYYNISNSGNGARTLGSTVQVAGAYSAGSGSNNASAITLVLNGSSAQTIDAASFAGNSVKSLTVSNSSGVTLTGNLTLVTGLTLTAGRLDIGAHTLSVPASGLSGGSATSYVKTSAGGKLLVTGLGNSARLLPVGNATYNPLTIASGAGNSLDWSVGVSDGLPAADPNFTNNGAVGRVWDITPSVLPVPGDGASITFQYDNAATVGATFSSAAAMQLWHYSAPVWVKAGGAQAPALVSGSLRSVTVGGLHWFSPYALANVGAPLPVSLIRFTGKRTNNVNELKWTTATESNNRGFAIERSVDGISFTQVAFVVTRATGGNSTSDIHYAFNDASARSAGQAAASRWYYRLKQEDFDGRSKYSAVVLLKGEKSGAITLDGIYPNPVKGAASVRLQASAQGGNVVLQLTDMQGRVVRRQSVLTEAGASTTVSLNLDGLAAGNYHLKAIAQNGEASAAVTVVKQ